MNDLEKETAAHEKAGTSGMTEGNSALPPEVVPLSRPFIVGDATYTQLTLREPFVEDQLAVEEQGLTQGQIELRLIARLCGVQAEAMRKLPSCDYAKLQRTLYGFLLPRAAASAGPRSNSAILPDGAGGK